MFRLKRILPIQRLLSVFRKVTRDRTTALFTIGFIGIAVTRAGHAQSASGTWPLTSATTVTATSSGNVTGQSESFSNLSVNNYSGPGSSQRVQIGATSEGTWPADAGQNETRYIQFAVSPSSGYDFYVGSISLSLGASGGGNMKANIWYSTDPTFVTRTQLNGSVLSLPNGSLLSLSYSPVVTVNDGSTFYLRIYPWYTSSLSGKYVCPQNVVISGTASLSSVPILAASPGSLTFGLVAVNTTSGEMTYSLSGSNLMPASGNITVTAPANFTVSPSSGSGFSSSLTVPYSSGTLSSKPVYVRFNPTAVTTYDANIANSGGGAATMNVEVTGQGWAASGVYVATNGSDSNPGTFSQPFATIAQAISVATAADTIYIRGGTYSLSSTVTISKSGSGSSKYRLFAYAGEQPVLDFSSMAYNGSNRGVVLSASYWHLKGLEIYRAGDNGMYISGSYNIVELCSFHDNRDAGLQLGGGASYNRIVNCDSYFNYDSLTSGGNADGFAPKLDVGTGNYFCGCRAWLNSDDGFDGYLRPSNDVTTTIDSCWTWKNGYLKDGVTSYSDMNGNGFKMGGSDDKELMHNMILKNCLSFLNKSKGFDQNHTRGSITLLNCTAYDNGIGTTGGAYNFSVPETLAASAGKMLTVENCMSYVYTRSPGFSFVPLPNVMKTNSWMSPFTVPTVADFSSVDTAGISGPRKADGSLPDIAFLHLASTSQFVDAGTYVGVLYYRGGPDLGAFEYKQPSDNPLPVQMISFAASYGENGVSLSWAMATELDNHGWDVERATIITNNGVQTVAPWVKIGFVRGGGTSVMTTKYTFVDRTALSGRYKYRLKQIDNNGTSTYSDIIAVEISMLPATISLLSYPNPFNATATIRFALPKAAKVKLSIYNALGQEISTLVNETMDAGVYERKFDGSRFASGMYMVRLSTGDKAHICKVLLVK